MRRPSQAFTKLWITIQNVCRDMKLEPDNNTMWAVGKIMQEKYYRAHGTQPPKENAKKTYGVGVHCFAHYPPDWREAIEAEIRKCKPDPNKQPDLF